MDKLLVRVGKAIVAIAATWAVGASLYIFLSPVSAHGVKGVMFHDSGTIVDVMTREQSWYEAQGLWGTFWLVFFSGLFLAALHLAWRGNYAGLVILGMLAVALSVVTGFSIGGAYLPAALGLFIASLLLLTSRLVPARC